MPITPTYPGVYIQELPSNSHTIQPAPTSITVFIGYTHPFKTLTPGVAVLCQSFADYEANFGGFFTSTAFANSSASFADVAQAVYQFFLNGGSECYVVGLQANLYKGATQKAIANPTYIMATSAKLTFTGLEPTDTNPISLSISNIRQTVAAGDTCDLVVTYGTSAETYRGVVLNGAATSNPALVQSNDIVARINGISSLITVSKPAASAAFDSTLTSFSLSTSPDTSGGFTTVYQASDFTDPKKGVFRADGDLDSVPIFNLMVLPGVVDPVVQSAAIAFCESKLAFYIVDPDSVTDPVAIDSSSYFQNMPKSANNALYFPYIQSFNPASGAAVNVPPGGTVAGIFARTDSDRGVWKAPAGLATTILNTVGVVAGTPYDGRMTDPRQGILNGDGINCLRSFPNIGTVVYGARTLVSSNPAYQDWKYVPVRRMALFLEQTFLRNLTWAVFEPNDTPLWTALRITVENFMLGLFNQGAFAGTTPSQAFKVICDSTTTSPDDVANGIVYVVVMFAPLRPAEFVIVQIAQLAGQAQS